MKPPSLLQRFWKPFLSLGFGLLVFFFWMVRYPFLLLGKEELNLFLWDREQLFDRLSFPGGFARYMSEFLTQFFYDIRLGALVYALLLVLMQCMVWKLCKKWRQRFSSSSSSTISHSAYLYSFIPSIGLWFLAGNVNILTTFLVAVVAVTTVMALMPVSSKVGVPVLLAAIPFSYWLFGPVALILPFCVFFQSGKFPFSRLVTFASVLLWAVACVVGSWWLAPYPLSSLARGIGYCFNADFASICSEWIILLSVVILPFLCGRYGAPRNKRSGWIISTACFAICLLLLPMGYHSSDYEEIEYDALLRLGMSDHIRNKSMASYPQSAACQLAVGHVMSRDNETNRRELMKALMANGLMNSQASAFIMSDLFFKNGLVNKSQHAAFEAMESVWYSKSARALRRLVETNLITGHYKAALKYISLLEETLFYRSWAKEMRSLAEHPERIDTHSLYGPIKASYEQMPDALFF